jgi:hypothetical protein
MKTCYLFILILFSFIGCQRHTQQEREVLDEVGAAAGTPIVVEEPSQSSTGSVEEYATEERIEDKVQDPAPIFEKEKEVIFDVPFTSQAPQGQWEDQIYQDGCEEASMIMALRWARGNSSLTPQEAQEQIRKMSEFEMERYGFNLDVSTEDTARAAKDFFSYEDIHVVKNISANDIVDQIYAGRVVVVAVNGKKLQNPYFSGEGPENHMLVIIGYDPQEEEFITNDPGTRRGSKFRYTKNTIQEALRDYPSGYKEPNPTIEKHMIIVERENNTNKK